MDINLIRLYRLNEQRDMSVEELKTQTIDLMDQINQYYRDINYGSSFSVDQSRATDEEVHNPIVARLDLQDEKSIICLFFQASFMHLEFRKIADSIL